GAGNGTFGSIASYAVGVSPNGIIVTDLDKDGMLDLVTSGGGNTTQSGSLTVLKSAANGTFGTATITAISGTPSAVTAGDLDHDGRPDLVAFPTDIFTFGFARLYNRGCQ